MPYTVVLSKLGEAFNFSPPYIEDAAMTERVSFKKALDDDGQVGRRRERAGPTHTSLNRPAPVIT